MLTLEEKQKQLVQLNVGTKDALKKIFLANSDDWKLIKEVFLEKMYSEWAKYPDSNQYKHQIYYNEIKKFEESDSKIFEAIKDKL